MKKRIVFLSLFLISTFVFAQDIVGVINTKKIEKLIIDKNLDSIPYFLSKLKDSKYKNILKNIAENKLVSNEEFYQFTAILGNRTDINYRKISSFIDEIIKTPSTNKFDSDYFDIKWNQISKLRDEVGLKEASEKQTELEQYVSFFNSNEIEINKAKLKLSRHPIVMHLIGKDFINGKKLCLESLKSARELKDKELQITFLYHLSDFLIEERKLQEYIDVSEESLKIESELEYKTSYYYSTTLHLIDAYIYKGGYTGKVNFLINEMYNNLETRIQTYSLYLKLIRFSDKDSSIQNEIYKKFKVENLQALVSKFEVLGKNLNLNDFYHILNEASNAFRANGFLEEAIDYKQKAIVITRKIYSQELASSLANYKTEQAVKIKEKEIDHEKEKTTLYSFIMVVSIILLLITLFVLRKIRKQSRELSVKNKLINKTLKEKELLVKEVHHRVKNNFQIVSSLLELQTKGIEDKKALELANEGKNRVKSMALIHQKLYQNENGLVDFDEYIKLLTKELSVLYSSNNRITTSISSKGMMFDVDTAIPLGLIINEIITNAYKYAFNATKENNLSISINKEKTNDYKLIIEDNGPGLADNFDVKKAKSLGLRLVNRLIKQLHGSLKQTNNKGARFEILFKDNNARQLVN